MNLENSMFHQGNGSSSNSTTMNLESLDNMYQQGNGVSNNSAMTLSNFMLLQGNGDHPRVPVTPERSSYMQRSSPHPVLNQRQGYQNNNLMGGGMNQVFSPEASVMPRLNPSSEMQMNQLPIQVQLILAQMQRNQAMQSANRQAQAQAHNNHGVLLNNQSMQSLNSTPSQMQGNQNMQFANRQVQLRNLQTLQGNQIVQAAYRQVQSRNNQGALPDNQSMQKVNTAPSDMQRNQMMQSANRQVQPHNIQGVIQENQFMQGWNSTPSEMQQGYQMMQSANRQVQPRNNQGILQGNQSMHSLNLRSSETQGNQMMQSANRQVQQHSNRGVLLDSQSMHSLNLRPGEMQGNQIGICMNQSNELLNSSSPKQISKTPDTVSTQMQGNQTRTSDWSETLGLYTSILHDSPTRLVNDDRLQANGCVPQNTDSHVNNYGRDTSIGNVQWQADMKGDKNAQGYFSDGGEQYLGHCSTGMLPAANSSHSHIDNNWGQQNCATSNYWQQECMSAANQTISTSSLEKNPSDGFQIPFQPFYDQATPSHVEYAAASSTIASFNNAPVTPEKSNQSRISQLSATENSSAVEGWNPEKDKQDTACYVREGDGTNSNQPSTVTIDSPSNSTSLKEKVLEDRGLGDIDSNKTPQQKPPKRKKHRPKVVIEGKPKRPPKPSPLKTEVAGDKSTGKRKYVRRKGLEDLTPQGNEKSEFEASNSGSGSATKPCRRELNFDSEQDETQEINKSLSPHSSNKELNSQETTPSMGVNCVSGVPDAKRVQQNTGGVGKQQSINSWNLLSAANQRIANEVPRRELKAQVSTAMDRADVNNIKIQNGMMYQVYEKDEQRQENLVYLEREQMSIQERAWATYKAEIQQLSQGGSLRISDCQENKTGQKRDYVGMSEQTSPQYSSGQKETGCISEISNLGPYKRTRHDEFHRVQSISPSVAAAAAAAVENEWLFRRSMFECSTKTEISASRNNRQIVFSENQFSNAIVVGNNIQRSRALLAEIINRNKMLREASQQKTEMHASGLLTGATYSNNKMESPQRFQATILGNTNTTSRGNAAMKGQTVHVGTSIQEVSAKKLPQNYNEVAYPHSSRKARGKKEERSLPNMIDDLIQRMELLGISDQQGALVPYKGHGTLVPFERFEPIRRRKPRPRVDLDSETITQWNLLMGKAENDAAEKGQDKEQWWKNEREVFRGRVDSFIARMHLVQGDRRFSRWKGSVVDSVIGVFLTQNVSDHLSSSAFMSLAAQFPLKSAATEITRCRTSPSPWVEEPEVQIIDPDGTITFPQETLRQPLYKHDSSASSQYFEQSTENLINTIGVHLVEDNNNDTPKDVVSSQNSSDSIILQASEDIRNSSDSEVEYQTLFLNSNQSPNQKTKRTDTFQQDPIPTRSPSPRPQQIDYLSSMEKNSRLNISKNVGTDPIDLNVFSSEESFDPPSTSTIPLNLMSDTRALESFFPVLTGNQSMSYPSEVVPTKIQGVFPARMGSESTSDALTNLTTKETGMPENNTSSVDQYSAASHNVNSQQEYHFGSIQPPTNINQDESLKSINFETSTRTEAQRPNEADSKQKTGNLFPTAENFGSAGSKLPKERRKKDDVKEIDWDELRRQVLGGGPNKERGMDKLDSMDYEDLSNAHVNRISDAIRERGMNNMLAERIKAFLNRLVKDHGSIDLEWLRDVPPDKAKDYLLSIRGLGLKSVECIRLLSLHHMAFPVDTNVGRIAVRLGWVPLQPLPESLQLHLLEMYPILESIQKYIWPRLCKLDQRTLYELHYQMITFGKVFCTKSKPNCNVCPMKAECRHFASAFASARLALPGPEEKGIVSSSIPFPPTEDRPIITDPLLLAFGESNIGRGLGLMHSSGGCEPHVEEPMTPEHTEETASDIEDLLSPDTNEIPEIKISIEALRANVQNIIQERNLEISETDLSKALVALNPASASIPAPKLKNVSRLRTEHHVYELPDWHPVLEGMDRREADDPSPYLLAIWTPGETPDTVQLHENSCTLRGSGRLCEDETCFHCNSIREADSQIIRGTILIPCRTAMRGSFPLNGTYFQVNEVFADHASSMNPIAVPRELLWNLRRRTVYFGTSVTTIFRGMPIDEIQYCFWRGFVCVRGFDRNRRSPRPLMARLHFPASRLAKNKKEEK